MPDVLTYRFGHDITNRQQLIDIDQAYWKLIVNGSIDFRYTIKNSEEFDRMIERSPHGFAAVYVNEKPALLLKAMMYVTGGLNMNIPQASDKLTGNGTWETFNPEGDTVTFVTCTASPAFFGYRIGDVRLTDDVLRRTEELLLQSTVRTLDAVHIASALLFQESTGIGLTFVTSDKRQAEFTNDKGLKTVFVGGTAKGREIPNDRG